MLEFSLKRRRVEKSSICWQIGACRGTVGDCTHSLVDKPGMVEQIEQVVGESVWVKGLQTRDGCGPSQHERLKVAFSACPNACTQPQIEDVGVIAICVPTGIESRCNGCRRCEDMCREGAIAVENGLAVTLPERCVGCGACVGACPQKAIESEGLRFRILVGGAMGRHPRWAKEFCVVDGSLVAEVIGRFLDEVAQRAEAGEKIASVAERIGLAELRHDSWNPKDSV